LCVRVNVILFSSLSDVAIGAPYENNGAGVVYIYHGIKSTDGRMEDIYVQKIAGMHSP